MQPGRRWMVLGLIAAALPLAACQPSVGALVATAVGGDGSGDPSKPASVERVPGTDFSHVRLTAQAADRLDIKTMALREAPVTRSNNSNRTERKIIPYAAVLYGAHGETWVYTKSEPLIFVRHRITVDYIEGDVAVLSEGPPSGTEVVTDGADLLFATEFEGGQ